MDLLNKAIRRNDNIAWRVIEGEALIVNPKDSLIYPLNSVGARIWELLNGEKTCSEVVGIINDEFAADNADIQEDVLIFIKDLLDKGLAFLV